MADPVAHEDADQTGLRPVERGGVRRRRVVGQDRGSWISVGGDRIALSRVRDLVHEQGQRKLVVAVTTYDQAVADALGVEEGAGTEEVVALRGPALVGDELRDPARAPDQLRFCLPTLELLGQEAPHLVVDRLAFAADRLAHHSLPLEAEEGHDLLCGAVGGGNLSVDPVGAVIVERVDAGLALGLPRDPLSPGRRVTDQHGELRAGFAFEAEQSHEPNWLRSPIQHNRPLAVAARVHRPLDPAAGVVLGEAVPAADEVGGHVRVVEPPVDRPSVIRPEVPQLDRRRHRG